MVSLARKPLTVALLNARDGRVARGESEERVNGQGDLQGQLLVRRYQQGRGKEQRRRPSRLVEVRYRVNGVREMFSIIIVTACAIRTMILLS